MNVAILGKIVDLVHSVTELERDVASAADSEKYAKSVEMLNQGVSDTYSQMREMIVNSQEFSDDEKLTRLQMLAESEVASKEKCGEAIKGNREHVASIAKDIAFGVLSGGLTFIPGVKEKIVSSVTNESLLPASTEDNQ